MKKIFFFIVCAFAPLGFNSILHADWPHLRGPNYDGISTDRELAESWPAEGPPRLWTRELGQGYSGFIVAGGKLYTQYQTLGGQFLLCLDPATGATLWEERIDWAWQPKGAYPGPYATPTFHAGKVFYATTNAIIGCVDANHGTPVWSVNLKEKFQARGCDFGYAATPLVEDGKVILPVGGPSAGLVALDADSGNTVWTAGTDPASYCPALPITFAGRRCVVGYLQNAMILVELASGKLLQRLPLSSGYDEHSAWPIYREPHLLLCAPFRVPATRLEFSAAEDGALRCRTHWLSKEMSNDVVSSVLHEKHLYGFDLRQLQASAHRASRGSFKCLDWETGKACWATDDIGHASVLAADGKLLMLNDTGTLILARADPTEYRELARAQLFDGEICWTPPTLFEGRLFVRSPSRALCVWVGADPRMPTAATTAPRPWRIDSTWLLSRERDYPNDAPTWEEMTRWFAACLVLAFGGAGILALLVGRIRREPPSARIFLPAAFVLGFLGPNAFSALADQCLFTWPTCVYAAFHGAVLACWRAQQQDGERRARWLALAGVVAFLATGYLYYELCKAVGMFIAWSFLVGFPAAFPFTFLAVYTPTKPRLVAVWTLLAFAAFFWSAQGLLLWKAAP